VDLASRCGIRVKGNGSSGWLDPFSTLGIGPYDLQLLANDLDPDEVCPHSRDETTPLSSRYRPQAQLPDVTLEMHVPGSRPISCPMTLTMALVGRSDLCKIRPPGALASRFYCSLLRTPAGIWLVDLLAPERVTVNGECRRYALLADGDEIRFGGCTLLLRDGLTGDIPSVFALNGLATPANLSPEVLSPRRTVASTDLDSVPHVSPRVEPLHSSDALAVLQQMGQMQQQMSDQFHETMSMFAQLFGTIHRDHMSSVRDELLQIRRLADEIRNLQSPATSPAPMTEKPTHLGAPRTAEGPPPNPASPANPPVHPASAASAEGIDTAASEASNLETGPSPKVDPAQILAVATAHLQAYQREQKSHWRRIMRILAP
jgi:hypothetical protein